jgi:hypothetical protein
MAAAPIKIGIDDKGEGEGEGATKGKGKGEGEGATKGKGKGQGKWAGVNDAGFFKKSSDRYDYLTEFYTRKYWGKDSHGGGGGGSSSSKDSHGGGGGGSSSSGMRLQ